MITNFFYSISFIVSSIVLVIIFDFLRISFVEFYNCDKINFRNAHIACLILARGGSKGIPHKNLAKLSINDSLLGNSLKIVSDFGQFNSIWVSTDDLHIVLEAKKYNAFVHIRESYTATDYAPSIFGVTEFISKHPEVDIVALVQCTSPFLKKEYLERAFMLLKEGYDSVFSVSRQFTLRWKLTSDGTMVPDNFKRSLRPRRQDWSGEIVENGMFYISYSELIRSTGILQSGRIAVVEVPLNESLQIDSPTDLVIANALLQNIEDLQVKN